MAQNIKKVEDSMFDDLKNGDVIEKKREAARSEALVVKGDCFAKATTREFVF